MRLSGVLDNRKDGSKGKLRIDYGDPDQPEPPVKWLWKFVVCGVGGYAESVPEAAVSAEVAVRCSA